MTVKSTPLTRTGAPSAPGDAANHVRHKRSLENGDAIPIGDPIFVVAEETAERRPDAQHRQEIRGYDGAVDLGALPLAVTNSGAVG